MSTDNTVSVVPYSEEGHLEELITLALEVQELDPFYPPRVGGKLDHAELKGWLTEHRNAQRWVAVVNGSVAGHVSVSHPHDYMISFLHGIGYRYADRRGALAEVGQFFVGPSFQRFGVGKVLFRAMLTHCILTGVQPVLAVMEGSASARRLYTREGFTELGTFNGIHGINHVLKLGE